MDYNGEVGYEPNTLKICQMFTLADIKKAREQLRFEPRYKKEQESG